MARLQKSADAPAAVFRAARPTRYKPCPEWQAFARELFPALADMPVSAAGEWLGLPPPVLPAGLPARGTLRAGVLAGRLQTGHRRNLFTPAHALFMAFGAQCQNREALTLADPRTAAWLRGEEIESKIAAPGWCAVLVDGLPLGGGKVSGRRIKNHYPKALRDLQ